jgi:hypothetical protein
MNSRNLMLLAAVGVALVMVLAVGVAMQRVARPGPPPALLDRAGWEARHAGPREAGAHAVSGDRRVR